MLARAWPSSSWRAKPRPPVVLAWGSQSISSVERPSRARAAARLMAVVVLPTPPFWLTTAMTLEGVVGSAGVAAASGLASDSAGELAGGLLTGWIVIIGFRGRVSGGGIGGNAGGVCRSVQVCGELVECAICCGIPWVLRGWMWKSFVPRGTFWGWIGRLNTDFSPIGPI